MLVTTNNPPAIFITLQSAYINIIWKGKRHLSKWKREFRENLRSIPTLYPSDFHYTGIAASSLSGSFTRSTNEEKYEKMRQVAVLDRFFSSLQVQNLVDYLSTITSTIRVASPGIGTIFLDGTCSSHFRYTGYIRIYVAQYTTMWMSWDSHAPSSQARRA